MMIDPWSGDFEPPSGSLLALFVRVEPARCEMAQYLSMLTGLADSRFPQEQIRRYVRGRYGLTQPEFEASCEEFDNAAIAAADTWSQDVAEWISDVFEAGKLELLTEPIVGLAVLPLLAQIVIEVRHTEDRTEVLEAVSTIGAMLAALADGRSGELPPLNISCTVWARAPEGFRRTMLTVEASSEQLARGWTGNPRKWLAIPGVRLHPAFADALDRALKPKLVALRAANGLLSALNRRLSK